MRNSNKEKTKHENFNNYQKKLALRHIKSHSKSYSNNAKATANAEVNLMK